MHRNVFNHTFSVFLDGGGMNGESIRQSLSSLAVQTYQHFEVIVLGETPPPEVVSSFADGVGCFGQPQLTAEAILSGSAQESYRGSFVFMLRAGDRLEPHALQCLNAFLSENTVGKIDLVTFDYVREQDQRRMFLPSWDPEFLEHLDYIRAAFCFSPALIGRLLRERPFCGVREFLLCAARSEVAAMHIGESLLHSAQPADAPVPILCADPPHRQLSIVIPNRNGIDLIPRCVAFLQDLSIPFDLVVVDNASDDPRVWTFYQELEQRFGARIIPFNEAFNYARMINIGVGAARHDFILLLNNDVIISDAAVILSALSFAARPEIGVVGTVMRYPDGTVQHAGMALRRDAGGNCEVDHILRFARNDEGDYFGALTAPRNWQCVTGAFQLIPKAVFLELGGYDDVSLPVEHNDVDFCLKVRKSGRRVICLPLPGIVHDESRTRRHTQKTEASLMRRRARAVMAARWPEAFMADPFVHPGLRRKAKSPVKSKRIGAWFFGKAASLWRKWSDGE